MIKKYYLLLIVLFATGVWSCREEYMPDLKPSDNRTLVVEGVLNVSSDASTIRLSRSAPVNSSGFIIPEDNAHVTVEAENGGTAQLLAFTGGGLYRANLNLQVGASYRVRIVTSDGKEYLSDYTTARNTPEIESVGWRQTPEGITAFVSSKDISGETQYYMWNFEETWEIVSYYFAEFIYQNRTVRPRVMPNEDVSVCWKYSNSSSILLGSSARLQSSVIAEKPLITIPTGHEKISRRYSILVKQYAIDKKAYEFYSLMKKNTESLGSIFDPQPSEIRGNFICVSDPLEPVIGHVTASSITEKRIFIKNSELEGWFYPQFCPTTNVTPDSVEYYFQGGGLQPYSVSTDQFGAETYLGSSASCVDCTKRGGNTVRPSYW